MYKEDFNTELYKGWTSDKLAQVRATKSYFLRINTILAGLIRLKGTTIAMINIWKYVEEIVKP